MNRKIYKLIPVVVIALLSLVNSSNINAQNKSAKWTDIFNGTAANFYDIHKDFEKSEKKQEKINRKKERRGEEVFETPGFEVYERWAAFMKPRVYPSGDITLPSTNYNNYIQWQNNTQQPSKKTRAANWTALGPVGTPTGPSPYSRTGAGRVNFVTFDPTNNNTLYLGAPDGGLWKSTNGGTSWTTNHDFLAAIGVSDLCIDPTNTQIMYLATGDREGNRSSIGVLKSIDGGANWLPTSRTFAPSNDYRIVQMVMNPSNSLNMMIVTDGGIYRTTDGWATNAQALNGSFKEIRFKPGDPNTVYAAGTEIYKSTDNGANWTLVSGLPTSGVSRISIAVTAADPTYVYALYGKSSNQSFMGLYRSTNSGSSFTLMSTSPNLLGYNSNGLDLTNGQAFYDLALVASPTNANLITTGGINHWQSSNGGANWTNLSFWASGEVHADIHYLTYLPGSSTTMFSCNDGGIFKSTDNGNTFVDISNNLNISQFVGIGLSKFDPAVMVGGTQDNGTSIKNGATWNNIFGGDGGDCFFGSNDDTVYIQYVQGDFNRSDDGGANFDPIKTGMSGTFEFYSNWIMDPVNTSILYAGGNTNLYRTTNKGNNWSVPAGTLSGSGPVLDIAVAASNHATIYVIKEDAVNKSANSGTTFTNVTSNLPGGAMLTSVAVSNTNPNIVWVTYSGYSLGNKIFKSVNGGGTWTNISAGLPNLPINKVLAVDNSINDAIYIGADIGVYYQSNITPMQVYNTALPNVAIKDLEINYTSGKLVAGTYGRGAWQVDTFTNAILPVAKLTFGGESKTNYNQIQWTTQGEVNLSRFELERSNDGFSFEKIASIAPIVSTDNVKEYSFDDKKLMADKYYYRLKSIDIDNSFTYSNVITLASNNAVKYAIYPNPADEILTVEVAGQVFNIEMTDINGKIIFNKSNLESNTTIETKTYSNGIYFLHITTKDESVDFTRKIEVKH